MIMQRDNLLEKIKELEKKNYQILLERGQQLEMQRQMKEKEI